MAMTIQTNIKNNTKSFENFSYFLGGIDTTHQNLDQFTPYIKGVSRIFLHKAPPFMKEFDGDMTKRFKTYLETGFTNVDGISDIDVDFEDFTGGFAGQKYQTVSLARDNTEEVTIQVYELTGSPIREYIDTWVTGVRDPRSGIAHYHGMISDDLPYCESNHTAEMIYINLDPTAQSIEYCCMFAHMFPSRVPKSHLNYSTGERGNAQLDLEFKTEKFESPAINEIGIWYLNHSKVNYNYLDFDPNIIDKDGNKKSGGFVSGMTYDYGTGTGTENSM